MSFAFASSSSFSRAGASSSSSSSASSGGGASSASSAAGVVPAPAASAALPLAPGLADADMFVWNVQTLTAAFAGGAAESVTVIGGPPAAPAVFGLGQAARAAASGLADILADGPGPGSVELGASAEAAVGTAAGDVFVYRAARDGVLGAEETILGFDPAADRLIVLGAPVANLRFDAAAGRAEVRLSDGGVIALHVAPATGAADADPLGPG